MRAAALVLTVLLTVSTLSGCDLLKKKNGDCVAQPGATTGYGQVCSAPPPGQLGQLGN